MKRLYTRKDADVGVGLFDSVKWVCEVIHVTDNPAYQTAVATGSNEDWPEMVEFYIEAAPLVTSTPVFTYRSRPEEESCD